jgi:glycosyltransferase involved in cell wall biosynthesis
MKLRAYLPYADETPAGLVRFSAHLVEAMRSGGAEVELLLGQRVGRPGWASEAGTRVLFPARLQSNPLLRLMLLPLRILWLQLGYPLTVRGYRDHPLLLLAHESAPLPWWDQVAVVHDLTALRADSGRNTWLHGLHHRLWLGGLRRSRRIVAISEATRADLVSRYPELEARTEVIHEGVDRSVFRHVDAPGDDAVLAGLGLDGAYLLYTGTLAPHKNVPFLVPVLARLVTAGADLRLVVVGRHDEADQDALRRLAREHGVGERLVFPGYVDDESLAALMRRCACFVFPSRNEGFGLAVVEAMACAAPLVCAASGSLPEVVADGGVLLSADDADGWVDEIGRVLDEPARRAALRDRGTARAAELTWEGAAARYLEVLDRMAAPSGRASKDRPMCPGTLRGYWSGVKTQPPNEGVEA